MEIIVLFFEVDCFMAFRYVLCYDFDSYKYRCWKIAKRPLSINSVFYDCTVLTFSDEGNETEVQSQPNSQLIWKQGRQLLRQ